jgi:general secretion pathway protein J
MKRRLSFNPDPASGFTLVELLVAISILALVAVLGWRGLDGIVRARIALTEQMETTRGMQLAFAQMQSDSEHMASDLLLQGRTPLSPENDRMTLVRTVTAENEPTRLQVVAYRIRDGMLTRRESIATRDLIELDKLWQVALSDGDTTPAVTLQAGVTGMIVQTWDNNTGWRQGALPNATQPNAPQAATSDAARGLRVELQVQGQETSMSKAFLLGGM